MDERHPQIQSQIDLVEQEWNRTFVGEWHREQLAQENAQLVVAQEHGRDLPFGETVQDLFCRVAQFGGASIRQLTFDFRGVLPVELRFYLDLGNHRDQREHPPMMQHAIEFQVAMPPSITTGVDCWNTIIQRLAWRLPITPPASRPDWPGEDWNRQLDHLRGLTASERENPADDQNYPVELGLVLDPVGLTVARQGFRRQISLPRRLFLLLQLLMEQPGQTVPWLMDHWDQVGRAPTSSRSTVDDTIAKLNNELDRVGLEVRSNVAGGKHLVAIASSENISI